MNPTELCGFLEDYLALKRTLAESSSRYDRVTRNQFNHRVSLLRSFFAFWKERGSPWPIRTSVALDWVALGLIASAHTATSADCKSCKHS